MVTRLLTFLAVILVGTTTLTGCANTIRGVGRDAANTVNATEDAAGSVRHSVRHHRHHR